MAKMTDEQKELVKAKKAETLKRKASEQEILKKEAKQLQTQVDENYFTFLKKYRSAHKEILGEFCFFDRETLDEPKFHFMVMGYFKVISFSSSADFSNANPYVRSYSPVFQIMQCLNCKSECRGFPQESDLVVEGHIVSYCKVCSLNRQMNYDYFDEWINEEMLLHFLYMCISYDFIEGQSWIPLDGGFGNHYIEQLLTEFVKYNLYRRNNDYSRGIDNEYICISAFKPVTQRKILDFLKLMKETREPRNQNQT